MREVGDYILMNDEQRAESTVASAAILEAAYKHKPMIVFESLCTLVATLAVRLDFPAKEVLNRIQARYEILQRDRLSSGNMN